MDTRAVPARGILQASVSQENVHELLKVAPHERYQSTATCVMAVGATLLHDPSTWTKGILDTILIWGYQLHQQVTSGGDSESFDIDGSTIHFVLKQFASVKPGTTKWFQINEEEARKKAEAIKKAEAMKTEEQKQKEREEKENQYVEEEEEEGYTLRPDQNKISDLREILMKCLKRFFKGSINSMILRIDRFTVAIWRSGSAYFIFDPMPRDDRGLILPPFEDGTACVIWYCALEPLVALIIGNFPGTTWSSIDIHQIRVWIPQAREDVVPQPLIEIVDRTMRTHLDALVRRGELFVPQVRAKNPYHRPLLEPVVELMDPYWRLIPNWRITVMIDDVEIIKLINPRVLQASSLHLASEALPQTVRNKQSSAVALVALALARMQSPLTWSGRTLDYIIHNGSALHAEHQLEEGRLVEQQLDVAQLPRSLQLGANLRLQARRLQYSQGCSWKGGNTALARCLEQHFDGLPSSDYGILELESDIGHRFAMAIIHSEDRYYAFDPTPSNRLMTKEKEKAAMFQCRSARELAKTIYAVFSNNIAKEALGVLAFQSYMVYAFDISPRFD
uniref:Uncharacterized protein n=1 Tax=Trichogramma kaykai TaxID=54128 RepID=A0ABD2WSY9_9HYME